MSFVLFYSAFLDLKTITFFPKILDFYFIFLALWLFSGKKIIWSSYVMFVTFTLVGIYKIFVLGFDNGFIDISYALIALSLIGLYKR